MSTDLEFSNNKNLKLTRLEIAKMCGHLGKDPWTTLTNPAYESCLNSDISIIISLYNYAQYIHECLESICASKTDNIPGGFEIIVVDDCSTDNSVHVVFEYTKKNNYPICLVKKLYNTGLADARNVGLHIARSPYIFILDADNWIYPNCLSVLFEQINSSNYASVYGMINKFDNQTKQSLGVISGQEWDVRELIQGPYIDAMAMFKKDIVTSLGGYSTELMAVGWCGWEDYDLWLKLAQGGYLCKFVQETLSAYRVHPESMVNITVEYILPLAKHFSKKFVGLIQQYPELERVFGFPRNELLAPVNGRTSVEKELQDTKYQLQQNQAELEKNSLQLQQNQAELEKNSLHLQQSQAELEKTSLQLQHTQVELEKTSLQLQHTQAEQEKTSLQLQQTQMQLDKLQSECQHQQLQLQQVKEKIVEMENSKFWKLQKAWRNLKSLLLK
ncbi:family 2 glycosyl transferase [Calothrix sp. NIES-4071]|nr:family 2 glycosyl transferase [Calothrix sp. NIES-4071]BAZ56057.1 family 2 glycosyl transferase [Calothrix sp. NIES-4105]